MATRRQVSRIITRGGPKEEEPGNIVTLRKIQVALMCFCVGCYVVANIYFICFYTTETRVSSSQRCKSEDPSATARYSVGVSENNRAENLSNKSASRICVPKCCALGQRLQYNVGGMACGDAVLKSNDSEEELWIRSNFTMYSRMYPDSLIVQPRAVSLDDLTLVPNQNVCEGEQRYPAMVVGQSWENLGKPWKHLLLDDGMVLFPGKDEIFGFDGFCAELVAGKLAVYTADDCVGPRSLLLRFYDFQMLLACALVFLMTFVYLYLPQLRNYRGLKLGLYLSSLGVQLLLDAVRDSFGYSGRFLHNAWFVSTAAQHFWLTAMCFDLWFVFSRPRHIVHVGRTKLLKLAVYSLYAWLLPSLLRNSFDHDRPHGSYGSACSREWGVRRNLCQLSEERTFVVTFVLPLCLQAALNLVIFASTLVNLRLYLRGSSWLTGVASRKYRRAARDGLWTYVRLLLTMGPYYLLRAAVLLTGNRAGLACLLSLCPLALAGQLLLTGRPVELLSAALGRRRPSVAEQPPARLDTVRSRE